LVVEVDHTRTAGLPEEKAMGKSDCNKSFTTAPAEAAVDAERADEFDHSEFSRLVLHNRVE
jgi:hypothetical protein